jgi:hypothetical protein
VARKYIRPEGRFEVVALPRAGERVAGRRGQVKLAADAARD